MCIEKDLFMKIDSIKNSTYPKAQPRRAQQFQGKGLDPEIINHINKNGSKLSRFLHYVGENQGEALNILVTAVGTAIICPIFIAFNPFSKENKNTKAYSAWRQPISAIIAVAAQLTITKWFNNWISKEQLLKMKDHAIILNCARGGIINEADLYEVLKERPEVKKS